MCQVSCVITEEYTPTNIISRTTLASEGIRRGFYAGTSPALVAYVSENSVLFTALGQTQKFVARVRGEAAFSCQFQKYGIRQTED